MKIITVIFILILSYSAFGQTKSQVQKQEPGLVNGSNSNNESLNKSKFNFSPDLEIIPVDYKGNSIIELSKAANELKTFVEDKDPPAKDEFETTAEYEKRLLEIQKQKSSREPDHEKKFVLVLNSQIAIYDADTQELNTRTSLIQTDTRISTLIETQTKTSSYMASNAFGVVTKVNKFVTTNYGIKFINRGLPDPLIATNFKVNIPQAKLLKENLRTLFYFELFSPYLTTEMSDTKPTLNAPSEIINVSTYYSAWLLEVWLIDGSSGKVLLKEKF